MRRTQASTCTSKSVSIVSLTATEDYELQHSFKAKSWIITTWVLFLQLCPSFHKGEDIWEDNDNNLRHAARKKSEHWLVLAAVLYHYKLHILGFLNIGQIKQAF